MPSAQGVTGASAGTPAAPLTGGRAPRCRASATSQAPLEAPGGGEATAWREGPGAWGGQSDGAGEATGGAPEVSDPGDYRAGSLRSRLSKRQRQGSGSRDWQGPRGPLSLSVVFQVKIQLMIRPLRDYVPEGPVVPAPLPRPHSFSPPWGRPPLRVSVSWGHLCPLGAEPSPAWAA